MRTDAATALAVHQHDRRRAVGGVAIAPRKQGHQDRPEVGSLLGEEVLEPGRPLLVALLAKEALFHEPLVFKEGHILLPDRPGLGLELDEAKLRELAA